MERTRILFIAPYAGLGELALQVAATRNDIMVNALVGNLDEGARMVSELPSDAYDVIVSRDGTAESIIGETSLPLVRIRLSQNDMLRALLLAKTFSGQFAVVGYPDIIECVTLVSELAEVSIETRMLSPSDDVRATLLSLKESGVSLVVGDTITFYTAKELGLHAILITSGAESISAAYDSAVQIKRAMRMASVQTWLPGAILDHMPADYVVFDQSRRVVMARIKSCGKDSLLALTGKYIEQLEREGSVELSARLGAQYLKINGYAIQDDGERHYIFFCSIHKIKNTWEDALKEESCPEEFTGLYRNFYVNCPEMSHIMEYVGAFASAKDPVLIAGPRGTLKECFAWDIHSRSPAAVFPFYRLDCGSLTNRQAQYLTESIASPLLSDDSTIYFHEIDRLSDKTAAMLTAFFHSSSNARHNRTLFSVCAFEEPNALLSYLIDESPSIKLLTLPSLASRREELLSLAGVCINSLNVQFGKQVAGFKSDAIEPLREFVWPKNIIQFARVLSWLVSQSNSLHITRREVEAALRQERISQYVESNSNAFPDGTLEEITKYVVERVLREENMNQSKTAKRLGISRSTLWRMIK